MTDTAEIVSPKTLSPDEKMEDILKHLKQETTRLQGHIEEQNRQAEANMYHYLDLYQKICSEKVIAEDQAQQFIKIVEELKREKESIRKLSTVVSTQFEMAIKNAIQKLEKDVGETVARVATEKTGQSIKESSKIIEELKVTIDASKERISDYESKLFGKGWGDILSTALISLGVSGILCIFIVKWLT